MPTEVQDSVHIWMNHSNGLWLLHGQLNVQEFLHLKCGVGTTVQFTNGSKKEPDSFFKVNGVNMPTFAIETGWSESYPRLIADKDVILNGDSVDSELVESCTKPSFWLY